MRSGTLWRFAVLASLALLMSSQLCMLTTCVPGLARQHTVLHACCRATPSPLSPASPSRVPGIMPCDIALHAAAAPVLTAASPLVIPAALVLAAIMTLAPPARAGTPFVEADTGPLFERLSPAPAGLRAPPQA